MSNAIFLCLFVPTTPHFAILNSFASCHSPFLFSLAPYIVVNVFVRERRKRNKVAYRACWSSHSLLSFTFCTRTHTIKQQVNKRKTHFVLLISPQQRRTTRGAIERHNLALAMVTVNTYKNIPRPFSCCLFWFNRKMNRC